MVHEADEDIFRFLGLHSTVDRGKAAIGDVSLDKIFEFGEQRNAVVDEIDLPVATHLEVNGIDDGLAIEGGYLRMDGMTVGRRRVDNAHVAGTHQGELEGARNGGGRHGEGVDIGFQRSELFFRGDTELLFFVDDEQPQVVPLYGLANKLMRTDEDVDFSCSQIVEHLPGLSVGAGSREVVYSDGESFESLAECFVMLKGQYRCGHHDGHLLRVAGGFEGGADGNLGFSESYIAAYESVHGTFLLHVGLHLVGGFQLVGRVFVEEAGLELALHERIGTKGIPFLHTPFGIKAN